MSGDTIDNESAGCVGQGQYDRGYFQINVPGTIGVFSATEALAWQVAEPHAALNASTDFAILAFKEPSEKVVGEALKDVWNRILARNLARAEATAQLMLSDGREALGYFQEAQCLMGHQTLLELDNPSVSVTDGM